MQMLDYFNVAYSENEKPRLYNLRNCIALCLLKMGKLEESFELMKGLVEDYTKQCGETHTSTVMMKINLVSVLIDKGYIEKALIILNDITNSSNYHLVKLSATLTVEELQGNAFILSGKYQEALQVFEELKKV